MKRFKTYALHISHKGPFDVEVWFLSIIHIRLVCCLGQTLNSCRVKFRETNYIGFCQGNAQSTMGVIDHIAAITAHTLRISFLMCLAFTPYQTSKTTSHNFDMVVEESSIIVKNRFMWSQLCSVDWHLNTMMATTQLTAVYGSLRWCAKWVRGSYSGTAPFITTTIMAWFAFVTEPATAPLMIVTSDLQQKGSHPIRSWMINGFHPWVEYS